MATQHTKAKRQRTRKATTADQTDAPLSPPVPALRTDEGVVFAWMTTELIVNMAPKDELYNRRRRELHINGVGFSHVDETTAGHWIYRHD